MLVEEILADVSFKALGKGQVDASGIASRSDKVSAGDLFFCIPGFTSDGHDFAPMAVERACSALVVNRPLDLDVEQYLVDDPRAAMALGSARFFGQPSTYMDVVGVTGTNGKTTTSYLVDWASRSLGKKCGLIGTVETRIDTQSLHGDHTTPESIDLQALFAQMRDAGCDEVSMEVSSHAIDLKRVLGTRFAVLAFSNLTQDHLDYHKTMQNYFEAKAALFDPSYSDKAAICIDDEYGRRLAELARERGLLVCTCGSAEDADFHSISTEMFATHTALRFEAPYGEISLDYPLIGGFNVQNVLLALTVCHLLGYESKEVLSAFEKAPQTPGRLERVTAKGLDAKSIHDALGFSVFVDYAHTPDSISKAIEALRPISKGKLIIAFGCGGDRDRTKRPLMGQAACSADYMIVTSDNPRTEDPDAIIADILPGMQAGEGRYEVIPDRAKAIEHAILMAGPGDTVLIAGKGHEDYQIVGNEVLSFDDRVEASLVLAKLLGDDTSR